MSLISFTPLQDGVTGVNAAATNNPLNTIFNDYNGNITDANISSSAAIAGSKIAPGSLPIAGLVQTLSNTGTAGGTFYYINLGGWKMLWGLSAANSVGLAGSGITVTLPTSFFSTIQSYQLSVAATTTDTNQYVSGVSCTATTLTMFIHSGTNGSTQTTSVLIIGT